jgi:maleylpyruvate isomerase
MATTLEDVRLRSYWRSSSSWRVRIALNLKGIPHEIAPVHLLRGGGEQHDQTFRRLNPMGQVPVLEATIGGEQRTLTQSIAIIELLDAVVPEPALIPADPWLAAKARQLAEVVNAGIQPTQNLTVLQDIERRFGGDKRDWGHHVVANGLAALEWMAQDTAGRMLVGDEVTVADLCLVPQLYNARRFGVDLDRMPTLLRVEEACQDLQAFIDARPDNQPDAGQTS